MTKFGITFNDKHSYRDFGLRVLERKIGNPSKIKRKERVPYSNIVHDFSGIFGGQEYEERELEYTFQLKNPDKKELNMLEIELTNWLMNPTDKIQLKDDYIEGYYFMAEVEESIDYTELQFSGEISVTFKAYSFKIGERFEGNDIWDEFNFLLDYAQDVKFNVQGSKEIKLYNAGIAPIRPIIISDAGMEINFDNKTFSIPAGASKHPDLVLTNKETNIIINGQGSIEFQFRKEVI